jgi:Flp pilus assembly protein TadG
MRILRRGERGQAMVEFAIIGTVLMMLSVGLVDVGRAFFQYNAAAAAARYGARWGSVVGGTCAPRNVEGLSSSDWCNQLGSSSGSTAFWTVAGNKPVWSNSTGSCPTDPSQATSSNSYTASSYTGSSSTTIVGAIVQRFDSSSSSTNFITGNLTPGMDLSNTKVCIQLPSNDWNSDISRWVPFPGDTVTVYIYYPFYPVGALLPATSLKLTASAQYEVE